MLALIQLLPEFRYDRTKGRFRNYLFTMVHHRALKRLRRDARRARPEMEGAAAHELYGHRQNETHAADHDAWRSSLLTAALRQQEKDSRIEGDTFAVFRACAIEGASCAEVAQRFGVKENYVYQVKHRLTQRLRTEVRRLAELSGFDGGL
jgi:RNA polymerase sigma-70 factor (ECF subfamily)